MILDSRSPLELLLEKLYHFLALSLRPPHLRQIPLRLFLFSYLSNRIAALVLLSFFIVGFSKIKSSSQNQSAVRMVVQWLRSEDGIVVIDFSFSMAADCNHYRKSFKMVVNWPSMEDWKVFVWTLLELRRWSIFAI